MVVREEGAGHRDADHVVAGRDEDLHEVEQAHAGVADRLGERADDRAGEGLVRLAANDRGQRLGEVEQRLVLAARVVRREHRSADLALERLQAVQELVVAQHAEVGRDGRLDHLLRVAQGAQRGGRLIARNSKQAQQRVLAVDSYHTPVTVMS